MPAMPGPGAPAAAQPAPPSGEAAKSAEAKASKKEKDDDSDDPFGSESKPTSKPGKSTTAGALGRAFLKAASSSIPGAGGKGEK